MAIMYRFETRSCQIKSKNVVSFISIGNDNCNDVLFPSEEWSTTTMTTMTVKLRPDRRSPERPSAHAADPRRDARRGCPGSYGNSAPPS